MTAARARASLAALALTLGACAGAKMAAPQCQKDADCGDGKACVVSMCLPRAAPPASWNAEVVPTTDSAAGFTELLNVSGPAATFDLAATAKVTVTGTLAFDAAAATLTTAHVVLKAPALIAGRPDLQYETDLIPPSPGNATTTFTLSVPGTVIGRAGSIVLLPTSPDDATHAPSTFDVAVAAALPLSVSSKTLSVRGRILSALGDPQPGFVARALQDGALASNVVQTLADGVFALTVPAGLAATDGIAVELEPMTSDSPQPHYWAKAFPLPTNADLGDVRLPAYGQPNDFRFAFHEDTAEGPGVVGAVVLAHTLLADDPTATTDFLRDATTDATGQASLSLLPGSTGALRLYDIAVVPPAAATAAATCLEKFPLATGGLQPAVVLARRPVVSGQVVGGDGAPVAGVVILATRTAGEHATACDAYASTPQVTTSTLADGTFTVPLDAGTYTLDLDPPAGAPYPRLTQTGVIVASASVGATQTHAVALPPGALVEGTLRDAAGQPLPLAGVRFYAPACAAPATCPGVAPLLEAQTRADANGHFRAVIPKP